MSFHLQTRYTRKTIRKGISMTSPTPILDTLSQGMHLHPNLPSIPWATTDYEGAASFLTSYDGSQATFNAYRREVERLLHWSWHIAHKSIIDLRRAEIEAYIAFCEAPPPEWIGTQKVPRFLENSGTRVPNPAWRPFTATVSKALRRQGILPNPQKHTLSQNALKEIFAILSSFYNFLIQEERTEVNPIAHIRQKSKFLRKVQGKPKIRRLSELLWQYVIDVARDMAAEDPNSHERTLFIMSAFYLMYLRISELTASDRWTPKMGDFYRDHDGLWWFTTVGKGNKERHVAVSDAMLAALKRYRHSMNLPALPAPTEYAPLIPKQRGRGPVSNTSHIRKIVQHCFDRAIRSE